MTPAQVNHLRRLLAWVRCEIGQSPDEVIETVRAIAPALDEIDDDGKQALVSMHDASRSVPKYVRAAVNSLSTMIVGRGEVVPDNALPVAPVDAAQPNARRNAFGMVLPEPSSEAEAARDMLDDARVELDMLRVALGVPVEPHQSLHERMLQAARTRVQAQPDYEAAEREFLGDAEKRTGIYAQRARRVERAALSDVRVVERIDAADKSVQGETFETPGSRDIAWARTLIEEAGAGTRQATVKNEERMVTAQIDYLLHDAQGGIAQVKPVAQASATQPAQTDRALREVVGAVLEGWTLPEGVRKMLEKAYYNESPAEAGAVAQNTAGGEPA